VHGLALLEMCKNPERHYGNELWAEFPTIGTSKNFLSEGNGRVAKLAGQARGYRAATSNGGSTGNRRVRARTITVLLVDARPWTREALARALEKASRHLRVPRFGDASDLAQADLQGGGPALVLLNVTGVGLADRRVSAAVATARSCLPGLPVVALSEGADADDIRGAIERGLSGYIPISLELRLVIDALRFVAAGGTFVPAEPLLASLDAAAPSGSPPELSVSEAATASLMNDAAGVAAVLNALTPRELAVLGTLRQGKSNKQIAREIGMREATVKVHVRHIMRKVGAVNRTQVALLADVLTKK
jgi:DNA-binding NarL/FixJ family response regulator